MSNISKTADLLNDLKLAKGPLKGQGYHPMKNWSFMERMLILNQYLNMVSR